MLVFSLYRKICSLHHSITADTKNYLNKSRRSWLLFSNTTLQRQVAIFFDKRNQIWLIGKKRHLAENYNLENNMYNLSIFNSRRTFPQTSILSIYRNVVFSCCGCPRPGVIIPPPSKPFAVCCMVCPPPILAPTRPEPVKPLQLPCPYPIEVGLTPYNFAKSQIVNISISRHR